MKTSQAIFALLMLGLQTTEAIQLDNIQGQKTPLFAQLDTKTKGYDLDCDDDGDGTSGNDGPDCWVKTSCDDDDYTSNYDCNCDGNCSCHKQKTIIKIRVRTGDTCDDDNDDDDDDKCKKSRYSGGGQACYADNYAQEEEETPVLTQTTTSSETKQEAAEETKASAKTKAS